MAVYLKTSAAWENLLILCLASWRHMNDYFLGLVSTDGRRLVSTDC